MLESSAPDIVDFQWDDETLISRGRTSKLKAKTPVDDWEMEDAILYVGWIKGHKSLVPMFCYFYVYRKRQCAHLVPWPSSMQVCKIFKGHVWDKDLTDKIFHLFLNFMFG